MVKSKEEIIASLKSIIGEDSSDEAITLLEDVTDTLSVDHSAVTAELEEMKQKYTDLDNEWRKRYRDRFYGDVDTSEDDLLKDALTPQALTYDSLFEEVSK